MGKLTTDQASRLVKKQARAVVKSSADFELQAANSAKALMLSRVFKYKRNAKGESFGAYQSSSHKRKRKKKGRQTKRVDLNYSERLFRSIVVGKDDKGHSLGISEGARSDNTDLTNAELTYYLEERYGPIFVLSNNQIKKVLAPINKQIKHIIKNTKP